MTAVELALDCIDHVICDCAGCKPRACRQLTCPATCNWLQMHAISIPNVCVPLQIQDAGAAIANKLVPAAHAMQSSGVTARHLQKACTRKWNICKWRSQQPCGR